MSSPFSLVSPLQTVRGRLYIVLASLSLCLFMLAGWTITQLFAQRSILQSSVALNQRVTDKDIPLLRITDEIRLDVIQVQQWLTDISATRGQDGLNDGLDEAEKFAVRLHDDIAAASAIAKELELTQIADALKAVDAAFTPYYDVGKTMAQAYIDTGPEGGNKMMEAFDAQAKSLSERVETMTSLIREHSTRDLSSVRDGNAAILEENDHLISTTLIPTAIAFFIGLVGLVVVRQTVQNLSKVTQAVETIAEGNLETNVPMCTRSDEIGRICVSVDDFRKRLLSAKSLEEKQRAEERLAQERAERVIGTTKAFEGRILDIVHSVAGSANALNGNAEAMRDIVIRTEELTGIVNSAADEATSNVNTVAAAAEELSASISEISRQANTSSTDAAEAAREAAQTSKLMTTLADNSREIGNVVSLINDIAEQTNLLALNATIEAARAGDAGKGFAVVAGEVKNLANQTARATEEISNQVHSMQTISDDVVAAISQIATRIEELSTASGAIAHTVGEQGEATNEIARNVSLAAQGTASVSENIASVSGATHESSSVSSEVLDAAHILSDRAVAMETEIQTFIEELRTIM